MRIWTDAITKNGFFDPRYTCDVDNSSPELRWEGVPEGTRSLVLIAEDPDAPGGVFAHWVVYQIPETVHHLPTGIPAQDALPNGIRQGLNSLGKLGYYGPCPPREDGAHHYVFRLLALNAFVDIPPRATREHVLEAVRHSVIEEARVTGRYMRSLQKTG